MSQMMNQYIRGMSWLDEAPGDQEGYPFSIPAVRMLDQLTFHPRVTFLVGENGSGKSTIIEAIAVLAGLNSEGGSNQMRFSNHDSVSKLPGRLRLVRGVRRPRDSYFLRAESYFNVGSEIERVGAVGSYGGISVHEQSHGESFLRLLQHRFSGQGLYLLDEPEAALSPRRQLTFLAQLDELARAQDSQFVIATHSPIILAYPHAQIVLLDEAGLRLVEYTETDHYQLTRDFLLHPSRYLNELCPRRLRQN